MSVCHLRCPALHPANWIDAQQLEARTQRVPSRDTEQQSTALLRRADAAAVTEELGELDRNTVHVLAQTVGHQVVLEALQNLLGSNGNAVAQTGE